MGREALVCDWQEPRGLWLPADLVFRGVSGCPATG